MMLYTIAFTCAHVAVHVLLYTLPRCAWLVCVRWPAQATTALFTALGGGGGDSLRAVTAAASDERRIRILGPLGSGSAAAQARDRFGIAESQLSNPVLHREVAAGACVSSSSKSRSGGEEAPRYTGPLYNGHLHTILGAFRPPLDLRAPEREVIASYDGNPTCLDWWLPTPAEMAAAAATGRAAAMCVRGFVVILPGLTGSSKEFYVRRMARQLLLANLAVCVINARGVADTPLEKPQTFSALFTNDVRHVMQTHLTREKVQERLLQCTTPLQTENALRGAVPIIGVAFSLGGLILSNYVSEQGEAGAPSGFDAVYTITSPHNVSDGAAALRVPLTKLIYDPVLHSGLMDYYHRHEAVLQRLPGIDRELLLSGPKPFVEQLRTVQDFDEFVTAPHFGFSGAEAYYAAANNFRRLHHSRTSQLCLVAANDPICGPPQPAPRWTHLIERHRAGLVYVEMPVGGHLGFLEDPCTELAQAANDMERFILKSITHLVDAAEAAAEEGGEVQKRV